jgi:hypothetical protein
MNKPLNQQTAPAPAANHHESLREPATDLWSCIDCGARIKLHLRRRNPGHCAHCGSAALKPWQLEEYRF